MILGIAAFSFSPGLVVWSGLMVVVGWLGAFGWAVHDMPVRLDWGDIGVAPTTEHFVAVFLSPNFIGTGSRIQESVAFLVVAVLIAAVMWRARRTVRRQLELDEEQRALTDIFGRYVPKTIADSLISDRGLLEPVEGTATVLFIDVAGFTPMTEVSGPRRVVGVLNAFFDRATGIINRHDGVVTQFIGDAIMASFNLPAEDPEHAAEAVGAALDIIDLVANETFGTHPARTTDGLVYFWSRSSRSGCDVGLISGFPVPGQEVVDRLGRVVVDAGEHVGEPGAGIDVVEPCGLDQGVQGGGTVRSAVGAGEGPVASSDGNAPQRPFGGVVGQADAAVVEEGRKGGPALHHVIHGLGGSTARRELGPLGPHPPLQPLDQRADAGLADDAAAFGRLATELALDGEDLVDAPHRLDGHRCPHGLGEIDQLEELGTAVGPA